MDIFKIFRKNRKRVNLNELAQELTIAEGLNKSVGISQTKEFLALLGIRWRNMTKDEVNAEVACIIERAGKSSEHKKG